MALYHYTCDHGARGIERDGMVCPNYQPLLGARLSWFTDIEEANRQALGLTSLMLACDRTVHRFRVEEPERVAWWPNVRDMYDPSAVAMLEAAPGAMPGDWWVAAQPIRATLDEVAE